MSGDDDDDDDYDDSTTNKCKQNCRFITVCRIWHATIPSPTHT